MFGNTELTDLQQFKGWIEVNQTTLVSGEIKTANDVAPIFCDQAYRKQLLK